MSLPLASCTISGSRSGTGKPDQTDHRAPGAGAVYTFKRAGTAWSQEAYIKASNAGGNDNFGTSVAMSADAATLAVGAMAESSDATGVNGDQHNDRSLISGAAYVFARGDGGWTQQAYVKASNTATAVEFGWSVARSADGAALAVSALFEDSAATGIGGDQHNSDASRAGAVFRFKRDGSTWQQTAYVKASNTGGGDVFGACVALAADATPAVGAYGESSDAVGIGGDQRNNRAIDSGAAYVIQ